VSLLQTFKKKFLLKFFITKKREKNFQLLVFCGLDVRFNF